MRLNINDHLHSAFNSKAMESMTVCTCSISCERIKTFGITIKIFTQFTVMDFKEENIYHALLIQFFFKDLEPKK